MTILNLDEMLGASLENVVAAPDYVTPENGVYVLKVIETKAEKKASKDKEKGDYIVLQVTYSMEQIIEQEGQPIKPGSRFNETFMYTEQGLPYFKGRVAAIAVANNGSEDDVNGLSVGEALGAIKEMEFKANIKQAKNGDRVNIRITNIRNAAEE